MSKYKKLPTQVMEVVKQGAKSYKLLEDKENYKYTCITDIQCNTLPAPLWLKGTPAPKELDYVWSKLPDNHKPCLYFFEIIAPDTETILNKYKEFRGDETLKHRASAALKKVPPLDTSILYVGKVKDDIGGRMVVHFAYYHVGATAGLQLASWANDINLRLNLHVYSFDENMHDFVSPLEQSFARSLTPLIGKH